MILIDGKAIAATIKSEIAKEVEEIKLKEGKITHLAAILVGHDGDCETYVGHKVKRHVRKWVLITTFAF